MESVDLEERTKAIGREIFARARHAHSGRIDGWLERSLMSWGMSDDRVKAQLFRFVDVLPTLLTPCAVNEHLKEYLGPVRERLPDVASSALDRLAGDGWLGQVSAAATRWGARKMARRFIAASDLPEAIDAIGGMRCQRLGFTIDLLGEAVLSEAEAKQYQKAYLRVIGGLGSAASRWEPDKLIDQSPWGRLPISNVSIKLSSLFSQFDPIDPKRTSCAVRERLRPILLSARRHDTFVNIDMEQFAFKDLTLRIFQEILEEPEFRDWSDVGVVVQAYLRSSGDDLRILADFAKRRGTPIWVRLVKGAYWDYERVIAEQNNWPLPVFAHKSETDANYERLASFLIEHCDLLRPAIGSHNTRSIARAMALAELRGLPAGSVEFQMLYGMADPVKAALVAMGQRVRVYTPFGQLLPGMAYLVRRLLENTSNESFLRAGFLDNVPEERLLMNPTEIPIAAPVRSSQREETLNQSSWPRPFINEPLSDFTRAQVRGAMQKAIESVGGELGRAYPLVIGGQRIETERTIESINPSHLTQVVGRTARASARQAEDAVAAAQRAFPSWRDAGAVTRAELLLKAAKLLRQRRFELAAWEVYETAKQWREADADVAEAIDYCEYYARQMLHLDSPRRRNVAGEENEYFYEPRGVAVTIAPWNFPLAILCGMTTAALASGNAVIMKPAEQSPIIAAKLMEVFDSAAFPPGVVNFLPGIGEEVGPALVNHPDVSVIAFTGSREVGLSIQADAAQMREGQDHIKRVITEMGGKNAIIVDSDADLDETVHGVVASAFGYAGQKCSACSRVIVLGSIYDAFVARLVEAARSLKVGPAEDPSSFVGPVIDEESRRRVLSYIEKGKQEGRLVYAADIGSLASEGTYVAPHIFADVFPSASIAQEEIFGPVLAVIRAADLTEALAIANGTQYGLTGGLYSRSPANVERVRREFRVGNLYINRKITGALIDRQPFGGFKLSGGGIKTGGPDYLLNFLEPRTITENTLRHGFAPADDSGA